MSGQPNPNPASLDPNVLGQVLQLQSSVHAAPDEERLMEVVVRKLAEIPGVADRLICIEGITTRNSCASDTSVYDRCPLTSDTTSVSCKDCADTRFPSSDGWQRIELRTSRRVYGSLFLNVSDQASFAPYSVFINNTVSLAALHIENNRNAAELDRLDRDLDARVERRTHQLQESETRLRESRKLLSDVLDAMPEMVWLKDAGGVYLTCNRELAKLVDSSKEKIIGGTDYDIFPKEKADFYREHDRKAIENRATTINEESADFLHEGYSIWIETSKTPVYDHQGKLIGVLGIGRDITRRKEALQESREKQDFLNLVVDRSPVPMWIGSPTGTALRANQALYNALNLTAEKVVGKYNLLLDDNLKQADIAEKIKSALDKKQPVKFDLEWKADQVRDVDFSGGRDLDMDVSIFPLLNKNGEMTNIVVQWVDITARKQAEEVLRESEAAVRRKLTAITEPDGDLGALELSDFFDAGAMQSLMDDLHGITGMCCGIADLKGNILASVGWRDICAKFHRAHPEAEKKCKESDTILSSGVAPGDFKLYHCKNNMWEAASPIMISGKHLGNIFFGQYFYDDEVIDVDLFRNQAQRYGFDEEKYLAAVDRVPRYSRETAEHAIKFCAKLAGMISTLSYSNILLSRVLSQREEAEKKLRDQEKVLSHILEDTLSGYWDWDLVTNAEYLSPAFKQMFGYQDHELENKPETRQILIFPEDLPIALENFEKHVRTRGRHPYYNEVRYRHKDGSTVWVICAGRVIEWQEDGTPLRMVGCHVDITARKQAEEALRESERKANLMADLVMDSDQPVAVGFFDGRLDQFNPAFCELTGYTEEELPAIDWATKLTPPEWGPLESEAMAELERTGEPVRYEKEYIRKDGTRVPIEVFAHLTHDTAGKPEYLYAFITDITERKQAEDELRQIQHNLTEAQRIAKIGSWEWDALTGKISWSDAMFPVFGLEPQEPTYDLVKSMIHPAEVAWWENYLVEMLDKSRAAFNIDYRIIRPDETIAWLHNEAEVLRDDSGKPVRMIGTTQDVTERMSLEEKLRQAHKMEAIGTLAGGIAHDFNNILYAILGNTEIALGCVSEDHEIVTILERVLKAGDRAKELVSQILSFSRQSRVDREPIRCAPVVEDSLKLLRATVPSSISLELKLNCPDDVILASPTEIHQIVINLCTNAAQAMKDDTGDIRITLENQEVSRQKKLHHALLESGRYLLLTVQDSGCGMPKHVLDRIYDPFFTTKELGSGTGLGLSVVHGIVTELGGTISVESEQDQGTNFLVFIPLVEAVVGTDEENGKVLQSGSGTILLVDDEEALVNLQAIILEELGYDVVIQTSSQQALKDFKKEPAKFDLVISDQTMPKITGDKLAEELLRIRPDLPVILCTGYSTRLTNDRITELGVKKVLIKPINKFTLAESISNILKKDLTEQGT